LQHPEEVIQSLLGGGLEPRIEKEDSMKKLASQFLRVQKLAENSKLK
jgi:hypothetical protein